MASILALTACNKSTVCTKPEPANLWIQGSEELNPDASGEPLPTMVRVYQLSNLGEIEQVSFEDMIRRPDDVLGETVLGMEEVTVYPGRSAFRSFERDPGANYVVGVAVVRQPSGTQWRKVLQTPSCPKRGSDRPMVRFMVDGYTIDGSLGREAKPEGCDDGDAQCLNDRANDG
ncbi:MAG: type VI secretion system lipoprotein TssJ [Myxococcota bacterium]